MDSLPLIHLLAAVVIVISAVPLILKKIKPNRFYGVRIRASFKSEGLWYEINRFGGILMLWWGILMGVVAAVGLTSDEKRMPVYLGISLVTILGGLAVVMVLIFRFAKAAEARRK
jgi:uncharacterized membrane protein